VIALVPGQVVSPSSATRLVFISNAFGQALAAESLSYAIFDPSGEQVFPTPSGTQPVDLVNDVLVDSQGNPLDPQALTAGFYAARWTVPSDAAPGRWRIDWTFNLTLPSSDTFTASSSEFPPNGTCSKFFEVVTTAPPPFLRRYVFNCDLREDLGCRQDVSDARLFRLAALASTMIDRVTGRFFEPAFAVKRLGGNSSRKLQLGDVIVTISSVGIDTEPTQQGDLVVELDLLRIYNRHLSQLMLDPDDRENPMLEFVHSDDLYGIRFIPFRGISLRSLAWPVGVQNVHVRGYFGFTDPDGSPWGDTPQMIQHATKLLVARELPLLKETSKREDAQQSWRKIQEKTRDLMIQLADPRKWGQWFGDPEIDSILASYVRPPRIGGA
jgi:hypothetical protein